MLHHLNTLHADSVACYTPPSMGHPLGTLHPYAHHSPSEQDRCPEDMLVLLRASSEPFVRTLFTPTAAEQAQKGRKGSTRGVAHKFNAELEDLTVHLLNSDVSLRVRVG